jgi:iron uptake system EfeUOB component EfeO/EfeM
MLDSHTTRLRLALFGGAALLSFPATIGGQAFGQADAAPIAPGAIMITLTDAGCDPAKVDTVAGKNTFNIKNDSTHVEWEILKDVMVSTSGRTSCRASLRP